MNCICIFLWTAYKNITVSVSLSLFSYRVTELNLYRRSVIIHPVSYRLNCSNAMNEQWQIISEKDYMQRKRWLRSLISATNYQCEFKLYSSIKQKIKSYTHQRWITSDQLTSHDARVQSIHKHRLSDKSTADILHPPFHTPFNATFNWSN